MEIVFRPKDLLRRGRGFTFDDVLIVPEFSEVTSRFDPNLESQLTKNYKIKTPIVTSNMDTITEKEMVCAMAEIGGLGILHRFMPLAEQVEQVNSIKSFFQQKNIEMPIAASIGVKKEGMERADALVSSGVSILTIDIAHGDSQLMLDTLDYVKKNYSHVDVIAGNVATAQAAQRLIDHGADCIKVGIGPGSMCTTRLIAGCGVPQLTALMMCAEVCDRASIPFMADGGLKKSGDIVKAFACGASTVMIGSLVAGTLETPGEVQKGFKSYRGMASKDAQVSWRGELPEGMAAEGEATKVACKGKVSQVVHELCGGIRSGMSYVNAKSIKDIASKAQFIEMSPMGLHESGPHGL